MDKTQLTTDKYDDAKQASTISKDATEHQRTSIKMVQTVHVVWLDNNINNNTTDCQNTLMHLHRTVNTVNTFTDGDQCIEFIEIMRDNKACVIISGSLGQRMVPRVHDMSQVDSIFIFCANKQWHEKWTKDWPKIKGVFTEISPICEALKQASQQCEQNAIPMSFVTTSGDLSKTDLDQLDNSFMYTQILKEILLTIAFDQTHIQELVDYCRHIFADNEDELKNIKKFEKTYRDKTPIWWYTYECFLYPMLNRALRNMDVDIIIKMGFFVVDLHRHLEQLYLEQFNGPHISEIFTVYRGQGMSKIHFEKLTQTNGGLMSFNNFLSTSKNRKVSLEFAGHAVANPDLVGILFVMTIDPAISTTPFALINGVSFFKAENEVLFSMHTVFRIRDIKPLSDNERLYQVDLTLTNDNDKDLRALTDRIREETEGSTGWCRLGELLLKIGQAKKAEQVYDIILDQTTDETQKGYIYKQLGWAKNDQGEFKEAIKCYEKSLEMYEKTLPPNHPDLAKSYNNIGAVYDNMAEYSKALLSYEKALAIQQQSLPSNHPHLAVSYDNIGLLYCNMTQYSKALSFQEEALKIRQESLPWNHPHLSASYNNIGSVYYIMGKYSKALYYYEKDLEISEKTLPPKHPDLASSYNNIGIVYGDMGEYLKAITYYEKALEIKQESLPSNHPDLAKSFSNIGLVYNNIGEYSKALSYYEKALKIQQESLSSNRPDLAMSLRDMGILYCNMGEYSKALTICKEGLEIQQESLPSNHPDLATSYNNIGCVYHKMGEYSKALSSSKKALEIQQESLPSNHPDLAKSYNNIGLVYNNIGEFSKALSFSEQALNIRQESLSSNHPDLASSYSSIGLVYKNIGEYSKALSSHEKALAILQESLPPNHPDL